MNTTFTNPVHTDSSVDVCVIGAGLSGLVSARLLESKGLTVAVLEASNRVGGRLLTGHSPVLNAKVDLGGAYVAPKQHRIMRLAKDLGVDTYKVYDDGYFVSEGMNGERRSMYPPGRMFDQLDFLRAYAWIHSAAKRIKIGADGTTFPDKLAKLDTVSVEEWAAKEMLSTVAREYLLNIVEGIACRKCNEVSMLSLLFYSKTSGSFEFMLETSGGAQELKFVGGSAQIAERIAAQLSKDTLRLGHVVVRIEQNDTHALVRCKNGVRVECREVIVAVAPPVLKSVEFDPPLPLPKQRLVETMLPGKVVKTIMYFKEAFWRKDGLSGAAVFTNLDLPVLATLDDCSPDGEVAAIIGFIFTSSAKWMEVSLEERKAAIAQQYSRVFESDEALSPIDYIEKDWREEAYVPGCYNGIFAKGTLREAIAALKESHGRIKFSGSETAVVNAGYMDGAVEAGMDVGLIYVSTAAFTITFHTGERAVSEVISSFGLEYKPEDVPEERYPGPELTLALLGNALNAAFNIYASCTRCLR